MADEKTPAEENALGEKTETPADEKAMPEEKPAAEEGLAGDEKPPAPVEPAEEMPADEKPAAEKMPAEALADEKPAKPSEEMPEEPLADEVKKPATLVEEEMKDPLLADASPAPVAPLNAGDFTLDDVDAAMKDARESDEIMSDPSKLTPEEFKKARSLYYRRLYKLGEVLTYAKDDELAPRLADERNAAADLLKGIGEDEQRLAQVASAASKWLAYPKRGEHAGIVLVGPVVKVGKEGKLFETQVSIPNQAEPVSVFSTAKPKAAEGENVILLGSVVDDPATNLPGYTGSETVAVWNGLMTPLPAPAAP